jgi:hypothetical protein
MHSITPTHAINCLFIVSPTDNEMGFYFQLLMYGICLWQTVKSRAIVVLTYIIDILLKKKKGVLYRYQWLDKKTPLQSSGAEPRGESREIYSARTNLEE